MGFYASAKFSTEVGNGQEIELIHTNFSWDFISSHIINIISSSGESTAFINGVLGGNNGQVQCIQGEEDIFGYQVQSLWRFIFRCKLEQITRMINLMSNG